MLPKCQEKGIQQADLYLEGLDQFSGWFYSSLLTSIGSQGVPPYKKIFVHGFTLDENGRKMSKSLGNVVAPSQITRGGKHKSTVYGVDVLRYWVAAHGSNAANILVSNDLIGQTKQEVDRLRNVFKFILGNLPPEWTEDLPMSKMYCLDRYMLHDLQKFQSTLTDHYESMAFNKVCQTTQHFVANQLSGLYFHLIKDRLYCHDAYSPERLAAVTVLRKTCQVLVQALSPIVPLLAQEVLQHQPCHILDDLCQPMVDLSQYKDESLHQDFSLFLNMRESLNKKLDHKECEVTLLPHTDEFRRVLNTRFSSSTRQLCELWQVPDVHVEEESRQNIDLDSCQHVLCTEACDMVLKRTSKTACPRCRRISASQGQTLCSRCMAVL